MPDTITIYKTYPFIIKEIADRTLEFTGSTEEVDRDREVVEVNGWQLENYRKNPVFMWAHDYKEPPIGKATKVWKRDGQLKFNIEFAPKETYEFADTIYKLYKGGFLNATSVGFIPDPEGIVEGDGVKTPRRRYTKQELLELSGVSIPSQVNALRNAIDSGVITTKQFETITKPEETDEYIRIPLDSGNHEGHRIRTIVISEKEGIKSIYCGTDKVVMTYLFAKDKGWDMAKARAWVKEHAKQYLIAETTTTENEDINILVVKIPDTPQIYKEEKTSQEQIIDEIDYLKSLIEKEGLSEDAKPSARLLIEKLALPCMGEDWVICFGDEAKKIKRISGSDIPDDINIGKKPTIIAQGVEITDILESIKRITEVK